MTLKTYKSTLSLVEKGSYYIELSNFIHLKGSNGGAINCQGTESDLCVTISYFYRCTSELSGGCV